MEKEISSGAMLGIVLIALAAIIALGFGVFSIAKGTANEGTVAVLDSLDSAVNSVYEDYNQKVVSGTQVMSAYNTFEGKPLAILIATTQHLHDQYNGTHADHVKPVLAYVYNDVIIGGKQQEFYRMINYNALLINTNGGGGVGPNAPTDKWLWHRDGCFFSDGFQTDENGTILYDKITTGFTKTGNTEYIDPNSRFNANIIKDRAGTIIGIAFTQIEDLD